MQVPAVPSTTRQAPIQGLIQAAAGQATAVARLPPTARTSEASASVPRAPDRAEANLLSGDAGAAPALYREPGRQQRLGELQQGLAYAGQLGAALQDLKGALSQALARGPSGPSGPDADLQDKLATVQRLWQERSAASAGQLDGQLQSVADGDTARQRFRIRGLDSTALSQGGAETLRLALPGQARSIAVPLDGQGLARQLQSLQRALAPTGLQLDAKGGELAFSAPESQWPALRDGLSLSGDGRRFPSGQMVRAVLQPQAQALAPANWQLNEAEGQRRALSQVLKAQERLKSAQASMAGELAHTGAAAAGLAVDGSSGSAERVQAFAAGFAQQADVSALDYEQLSQLVPALLGLGRSRLQQLLGPAS